MTRILVSLCLSSVLLAFLLVTACSQERSEEAATAAVDDAEAVESSSGLPTLADLDAGWNRIEPGGETTCSDGSDYSFFVRAADTSKLLVYLQGGGGCWNADTCDLGRIGSYRFEVGDTDPASAQGIFDLENPENPFADHSMVFIPYCTGDVHLGDNVETYQVAALPEGAEVKEGADPGAHETTVHHRGMTNAEAVLEWTYANFGKPENIFVTGSSAGSIPSPYYAAHVAARYPNARIAQLGDGSGGYRRDNDVRPHASWGTLDAIDALPEFRGLDDPDFDYESLYVSAANEHPEISFARYDAAEDAVQLRFLTIGGQNATSLAPLLAANNEEVRAATKNVRTFVAGGDSHTILGRPEFYTFASAGVRIRDWVAALAAGEPVEDVSCEPCDQPELVPLAATSGGGH